MKPIQVTVDEDLLRALDADERVQQVGRSALFRELARDHLRRERERCIDEQYARAYDGQSDAGPRWVEWEEEDGGPPEPPEGKPPEGNL